jgi:hypothetical protein
MRLPVKGEELKYQHFTNCWKEMYCAYLKEIGNLYILSAPIDWCLFSVKVCLRWYSAESSGLQVVTARQTGENLMARG